MPLVRYEVRCEHKLANPELYRTVHRDDSEGLLEGVAMAGFVGIVRQLGDLAEFAAEIFHDLHEDIMTIVSRSQNLKTRVTQLEANLPAIEKALLAEASQFRFAYTERSKWRSALPIDQSQCAQGELPHFVRNFYEDCRGPPRLFLLDKFDAAGQGACVKRYTDPTFFRLNWAASQLERAERAERERQAQKEKKSRTISNGNGGLHLYSREPLLPTHFENLEGFTGDFNLPLTPELRSRRLDRVPELTTEGDLTPSGAQSPERTFEQLEVIKGPVLAPLKITAKDIENAHLGRKRALNDSETSSSSSDGASMGEYFVDALTTMGSDVESDTDSRYRWDPDALNHHHHHSFEADKSTSATLNHLALKAHVEVYRQTPPRGVVNLEHNTNDENFSPLRLEAPSKVAGYCEEEEEEEEEPMTSSLLLDQPSTMEHEDDDAHFGNDSETKNDFGTPQQEDIRNSTVVIMNHEDTLPVLEVLYKSSLEVYDESSRPQQAHRSTDLVRVSEGRSSLLRQDSGDQSFITGDDNMWMSLNGEVSASLDNDAIQSGSPSSYNDFVTTGDHVTQKQNGRTVITLVDTEVEDLSSPRSNGLTVSGSGTGITQGGHHVLTLTTTADNEGLTPPRSNGCEADNDDDYFSTPMQEDSRPSPLTDLEYDSTPPPRRNGSAESSSTKVEARRRWEIGGHTLDKSILLHDRKRVNEKKSEDVAINLAQTNRYELAYSLSSNTSSPYTQLSTSSALEDEEEYTSSASSSPKLTAFCALLSPPGSPPRLSRGLMGSPALYNAKLRSGLSSPISPPIISFLCSSPTASRPPHESPFLQLENASSPPLPPLPLPPPMSPPLPELTQYESPSRLSTNAAFATSTSPAIIALKPSLGADQGYALKNQSLQLEQNRPKPHSVRTSGAPRLRTWTNPSKSDVEATLLAIRQAAAIASDDETRSEHPSD